MTSAQINLTDSQADALHSLALETGKTEDELLQDVVQKFIGEIGDLKEKRKAWLAALRGAKGMWKDRDDLPDFEKLRAEWDRSDRWSKH